MPRVRYERDSTVHVSVKPMRHRSRVYNANTYKDLNKSLKVIPVQNPMFILILMEAHVVYNSGVGGHKLIVSGLIRLYCFQVTL